MINFTDLYDKTIDDLFAFGAKFTTDREMIKDCIQDVFVKLYTKRNELDSVANMESYLYASLRNRINDEFRRSTHMSDNEIDENHMKTVCDNGETYDLERIEEERKKSDKLNEFPHAQKSAEIALLSRKNRSFIKSTYTAFARHRIKT